jgi:hypothetical protein
MRSFWRGLLGPYYSRSLVPDLYSGNRISWRWYAEEPFRFYSVLDMLPNFMSHKLKSR